MRHFRGIEGWVGLNFTPFYDCSLLLTHGFLLTVRYTIKSLPMRSLEMWMRACYTNPQQVASAMCIRMSPTSMDLVPSMAEACQYTVVMMQSLMKLHSNECLGMLINNLKVIIFYMYPRQARLNSYISLASFLWNICKQYCPRCSTAERGVPSGIILFA